MADIEFIRKKHFLDGWSVRQLSRQLRLSRQAVRKALANPAPPRYQLTQPRPSPVIDPVREVIRTWLAADQQAPRKQRHTATRIYRRLVDEHEFTGAESTVRRAVAQLRPAPREVFIPLAAAWGQQAQVDWGQATVELAGQAVVVHLFCLRLRASGVPFVWAAPTEKLEAFLEGHCRAFAWLGGVPTECVYDNPKTAVVRILAGPYRQEHEVFASLRAHYLFDSLFCRPAQGHEKGAVEHLVGYVRRNALVPVPAVGSWDALNAHLLAWCERERTRLATAWTQEQGALRPLPAATYCPALTRLAAVSRLSLVTVDHNRYSVPCRYVGRTLRVALFADRVAAWDGATLVASHPRCYARAEMRLQVEHYLPALAHKPRAATHAAVVRQLPPIYAQVRDRLCAAGPEGYREFVALLLLHGEFPATAVADALTAAWEHGCLHVAAVRQLLLNATAPVPLPTAPVPAALAAFTTPPPDLSVYSALVPGGSA